MLGATHPLEHIAGDTLHACVRPFGLGVHFGTNVARRLADAIGPPAGGGVEDEVLLRSREDGRRITAAVGLAGRALRRAGGNDLQPGNRRRIAVPLPAHQSRNPVAGFHAGAGEEPVVRPSADPVRSACDWTRAVGPDQLVGVRPLVSERLHLLKLEHSSGRPKDTDTLEGADALVEEDPPTDSIAG